MFDCTFDLKTKVFIDESFELEQDQLGSFCSNYDTALEYFGQAEHHQLDYRPFGIVGLNNTNILVSSIDDQFLALYDSELNLIRKIDLINSQGIQPMGPTSGADGNIFVTNCIGSCIYKLNSEFKMIKSYEAPNKITTYEGIQLWEDQLYVCLSGPKRIEIFDLDLNLVSKHAVHGQPFRIKLTKDRACVLVKENGKVKTCFYKLPAFDFISNNVERGLMLLAHREFFYEYNGETITAFSKNGELIDEKKTNWVNKSYIRHFNQNLNVIDGHLYLCLDKQLCKIKFN
jgi:hypothetical protein